MYLVTRKLLFLLFPLIVYSKMAVAQTGETLEAAWVKKDVEGVSIVLKLLPFENQSITLVKSKLKGSWSVEEQDFGFGGKRLEFGKGNGYTKMFVEAFVVNGHIAYYEMGIESYSKEWPRIRNDIIDAWQKTGIVEPKTTEHRVVYIKTIDSVLDSYRDAVSAQLGKLKNVDVPANLRDSYELLTSFMENSAVSDGGCGLPPGFPEGKIAIDELVERGRFDLIENVLRGYNPGARVYAALALLEREKDGHKLNSDVQRAIQRIISLKIPITTCSGCFVYYETARKVLQTGRP